MADPLPTPIIDLYAADTFTAPAAGTSATTPAAAAAPGVGLPAVMGVPFPQGALANPAALRLAGPDGSPRPLAARTLVPWPDGSTRWALLAFQATQRGAHRLTSDGENPPPEAPEAPGASPAANPPPSQPVRLTRSGQQVTLDNGLVRVTLAPTGPGPIAELTAHGHRYLARPEDFRLVVDAASTLHEREPRKLTVLEDSPLRVRVRLEGTHRRADSQRLLHYRLDAELWAGWPTLRLDYHFFNLEPGHDELEINRIAAEFDFALGAETRRHVHQNTHGLRYVPRDVHNPGPVAIVADDQRGNPHVEHPSMLLDDVKYPPHLRPPLTDTPEWLGVNDGQRCVYLKMQDFAAMRPKRLASDGSRMSLEVWPPFAGRLALFQGRSRRQVMTLTFAEGAQLAPGEVARRLGAPLHEGRACVAAAWLRQTREFDLDRTLPTRSTVRFEKYLRRLVHLETPQDMWDLGDTIDSGYTRTYIPIGNAQPPRPGAPRMPRVFLASGHSPFAEWAFPHFYEPVWTNNEYDAIHAMATEVMRTGLNDLWTPLRWFVRHNIEVDFVHFHEDLQQNRATPQHSYKHNRSGAIPSHFWTQGLLEYHCLTGDGDVLEIARALGDKIIEDLTHPELREGFWGFTRELGWPTLALSHLVSVTGDARYKKQLDEIVDFFVSYDRKQFRGAVNLSSGDDRFSLERQMISGFFAYASMVEGVDHYERHFPRKTVADWLAALLHELREALDAAHREGWPTSIHNMHPLGMAIGYERSGDPRFLNTGMITIEELLDSSFWGSPIAEVKQVGMAHRGLVRFLGHAQKAGLLERLEYPGAR